jgi:hypothetical protein
MPVTTNQINRGSEPGDGTGDTAYDGTGIINANTTALDNAVSELQSGKWLKANTNWSLNMGNKVIANNLAGPITYFTLPVGAVPIEGDDFNDIWIFNNDDTYSVSIIAPASPPTTIHYDGANYITTSITLPPGKVAHLVQTANNYWDMNMMQSAAMNLNADLDDCVVAGEAEGDFLIYTSSKWRNQNAEECDLMERDTPAAETTPFLKHETRAARSSGTETIVCADDPSVYLPVSGNNVTINLDTPALSLPERGLSAVALRGLVVVKPTTTISGLTVTTDAGTTIGTFPKGAAPTVSTEYATLAWHYFDDGTTDFMWAEWINDA